MRDAPEKAIAATLQPFLCCAMSRTLLCPERVEHIRKCGKQGDGKPVLCNFVHVRRQLLNLFCCARAGKPPGRKGALESGSQIGNEALKSRRLALDGKDG